MSALIGSGNDGRCILPDCKAQNVKPYQLQNCDSKLNTIYNQVCRQNIGEITGNEFKLGCSNSIADESSNANSEQVDADTGTTDTSSTTKTVVIVSSIVVFVIA